MLELRDRVAIVTGMVRTGMNPIGTIEPSAVAANVVDAVRSDRPYVFTDEQSVREVDERLRSILAARAQVISSDV